MSKFALPVLLLSLLAPAAARAQGEAPRQRVAGDILCDDDLLICRESCSMELGTRAQNRERVARCLYRCEQTHTVCLQRVIAKRQAAPRAAETPEKKQPAPKEEHYSGAPTRFSQEEAKPVEQRNTEDVAPVRRSVTRSTELEAAPDRSVVDYPDRAGVVTKGKPRMEPTARPPPEEEAAPVVTPPPADPVDMNELGY